MCLYIYIYIHIHICIYIYIYLYVGRGSGFEVSDLRLFMVPFLHKPCLRRYLYGTVQRIPFSGFGFEVLDSGLEV